VSEERTPVTGRKRDIAIWLNKRVYTFSKHWLAFISSLVLIYAGLPIVAPVLAVNGAVGPAEAIYQLYSPFCHQFAFRSFIIGGDQIAYPRARANSQMAITFEEAAADEPFFTGIDLNVLDTDLVLAAKDFRGSETFGYKTALCQRDVAIYMALALAGFFMVALEATGRKVPYLPFWAYVLIAIAPIGLDGFSQLFANPPFNGFGLPIYPIRESTPFLRSLTGALFGLGNAWLAFPYIRDSMEETELLVRNKLINAGELPAPPPTSPLAE